MATEKEVKTVKATVAPGCRVMGHDGKEVKAGGTVTVSDAEAKLLTSRGFLVGKDGSVSRTAPPAVKNEPGTE